MGTVEILVEGRNQNLLIERLKRKKIAILSAKKVSDKEIYITIKYKDIKKAFTIFGNMWYNKAIKYRGFAKIINSARKNIAIILAVFVFAVSVILSNNLIFSVNIDNLPSVCRSQARKILNELGYFETVNFGYDSQKITSALFENIPSLDMVTVKKSGYTLVISGFSKQEEQTTGKNHEAIFSKHSGVVKQIIVYSGIAKVSVGDSVQAGDKLVEGIVKNEQNQKDFFAVADVFIECETSQEFITDETSTQKINELILLAQFLVGEYDFSKKVEIEPLGDRFLVKITLNYLVKEDGN